VESRQSNQPNPEKELFFEKEGYWDEEDVSDQDGLLDLEVEDDNSEGLDFLHEAHQALNKLAQKTHTRSRIDRQPRRADNWH
jgi:hypothetical protein